MSFHPLYRGTWYLTRRGTVKAILVLLGFHPLYRGTWYLTDISWLDESYSSDCFHPLYRGTWYLTGDLSGEELRERVSIRYIAVLGI